MTYDANLFEELKIPLPKPGERKYWFLRTEQGNLFSSFFVGDHIAIGWDKVINLDAIKSSTQDELKDIVMKLYPEKERAGLIAGTIIRFVVEMSAGDIIVCPDDGSHRFIIGEVIGDTYIKESRIVDEMFRGEATEFYKKRRRVKWLTTQPIPRGSIDIGFRDITNAHNTLTDATEKYSDYINRFLYPLYIDKDEKIHTTYKITQENGISAESVMTLLNAAIEYHRHECEQLQVSYNPEALQIKLSLNSPGIVELIATGVATGAVALLFLAFSHFLNGGKFSFSIKKEETRADVESEGFLEKKMKQKNLDFQHEMERVKYINENLPLAIGNEHVDSSIKANTDATAEPEYSNTGEEENE